MKKTFEEKKSFLIIKFVVFMNPHDFVFASADLKSRSDFFVSFFCSLLMEIKRQLKPNCRCNPWHKYDFCDFAKIFLNF